MPRPGGREDRFAAENVDDLVRIDVEPSPGGGVRSPRGCWGSSMNPYRTATR